MNAAVNTNNYEANKVKSNEFINDLLNNQKNEFEWVLKKIWDSNTFINLEKNEGQAWCH